MRKLLRTKKINNPNRNFNPYTIHFTHSSRKKEQHINTPTNTHNYVFKMHFCLTIFQYKYI